MAGWFETVSSPESISAIAGAIAVVIGAIATAIRKLRGKKPIEIVQELAGEQGKELVDVVKTQAKIIEKAVKCNSSKSDKPKESEQK